jgi:hypothetical protein
MIPQSSAIPKNTKSGGRRKSYELSIGRGDDGDKPALAAARLTAFWSIDCPSDPLYRALERVPEIGDTTAIERLALDT